MAFFLSSRRHHHLLMSSLKRRQYLRLIDELKTELHSLQKVHNELTHAPVQHTKLASSDRQHNKERLIGYVCYVRKRTDLTLIHAQIARTTRKRKHKQPSTTGTYQHTAEGLETLSFISCVFEALWGTQRHYMDGRDTRPNTRTTSCRVRRADAGFCCLAAVHTKHKRRRSNKPQHQWALQNARARRSKERAD